MKEIEIPVNVTGNADAKLNSIDSGINMLAKSTQMATTFANGFSASWGRASRQLAEVEEHTKSMNQVNLRATYTMFQMNQVVRDLPFGFIAISNNLPLLYDQFMMLSRSAGGVKNALSAVGAAIFSPSGIAVAISGLISVFTVLAVKSQKSSDELGKFTLETIAASTHAEKFAESILEVRKELEKMTDAQVVSRMERMNQSFKEAHETFVSASSLEYTSQYGAIVNWLLGQTPEDSMEKMKQALAGMNEAEEILGGKRSKIGSLQKQIKDLEKSRFNLPEDSPQSNFDAINERIKFTQAELDKLLGKQKDYNKDVKDTVKEWEKVSATASGSTTTNAWDIAGMGLNSRGTGEAMIRRRSESAGLANFSRKYTETIQGMNRVSEIGADVLRNNYNMAWEDVFGRANSLFEQYSQRIVEFAMSDVFAELGVDLAKWGLTALGFPELAGLVGAADSIGGSGSGGDRSYYLIMDKEVIGKFVDGRLPQSTYINQKLGNM